ncbi:YigZ family protein [Acanthopleuribacter pedis]|uniref:YigZ family protein n=1 Tax=Acanthopleuribacter pedis TaxID=442870 RepID=A0A8J7U2S3_9BACT|nr:YigZ family protein [Acanthopleuribacter pedis]
MSDRFLIPVDEHQVEEEIQRSRFITTLCHAPDPAAAQAFIARMRGQYEDATHNCWAYLAGPPGSSAFVGMSDDGEPHGTAGRPMLLVLTHSGIGEIAAVVTRYYGGTKLGKGGLVRAYSGGVQAALATLPTKEKITYTALEVVLPYSFVTQFKLLLTRFEGVIDEEHYELDAQYALRIPSPKIADFEQELDSLTNGAALVSKEEP